MFPPELAPPELAPPEEELANLPDLAPDDEALALTPETPVEQVEEEEHFCDSEVARNLHQIIEHLEQHDRFSRDKQIKKWRKQNVLLG